MYSRTFSKSFSYSVLTEKPISFSNPAKSTLSHSISTIKSEDSFYAYKSIAEMMEEVSM